MSVAISGRYVDLCAYRYGTGHRVQDWKTSVFSAAYTTRAFAYFSGEVSI